MTCEANLFAECVGELLLSFRRFMLMSWCIDMFDERDKFAHISEMKTLLTISFSVKIFCYLRFVSITSHLYVSDTFIMWWVHDDWIREWRAEANQMCIQVIIIPNSIFLIFVYYFFLCETNSQLQRFSSQQHELYVNRRHSSNWRSGRLIDMLDRSDGNNFNGIIYGKSWYRLVYRR